MKNPYEGLEKPDATGVNRAAGIWLVVVFLLILIVPMAWRNVSDLLSKPEPNESRWVPLLEFFAPGKESRERASKTAEKAEPGFLEKSFRPNALLYHFNAWESATENKATFREVPRRWLQTAFSKWLHEGNRKAVLGRDGWFFYRPALDSLTGYGPIKPEPQSVANDPRDKPWTPPRDVIIRFGRQLKEFGVELVLVPIPVKPMLYPEFLTGRPGGRPIRHRDAEKFYEELREGGVDVLDLTEAMWKAKPSGQSYLKQDTHWEPATMELAAKLVANHLKAKPWFGEIVQSPVAFDLKKPEPEPASHGDLVRMLELPGSVELWAKEPADVNQVLDPGTGKLVESDSGSPVVLLGDSFVNVFHDKGLHFALENDGKEENLGAGFAQHLAAQLGMRLDVFARNGQAATVVRQELGKQRGPEAMRKKRVVVWALAARDLFLSKSVARESGVDVEWKDVQFVEPKPAVQTWDQAGELEVVAVQVAPYDPDPKKSIYQDALYVVKYQVVTADGEPVEGRDITMVHWAWKSRNPESTFGISPGDERTLRGIVSFFEKAKLQTVQKFNLKASFDLEYWADEVLKPEGLKERGFHPGWYYLSGIALLLVVMLVFRLRERPLEGMSGQAA